jgi:hypothetical protein
LLASLRFSFFYLHSASFSERRLPNTSFERTREGSSAKLIRQRARRSTQPLGILHERHKQ